MYDVGQTLVQGLINRYIIHEFTLTFEYMDSNIHLASCNLAKYNNNNRTIATYPTDQLTGTSQTSAPL